MGKISEIALFQQSETYALVVETRATVKEIAMTIGRSFMECLQSALRSREIGARGLGGGGKFGGTEITDTAAIANGLVRPTAERIFYMRYALLAGMSRELISENT